MKMPRDACNIRGVIDWMRADVTQVNTCAFCASDFTPKRRTAQFCGKLCQDRNRRINNPRRCEVAECDRAHESSGYCKPHWRQFRGRPTPQVLLVCDHELCDNTMLRDRVRTRKHGQYCSDKCRAAVVFDIGFSTPLPADHWALWYGKACRWVTPLLERGCYECGEMFIPGRRGVVIFCSEACSVRVKRRRRRARERGADGDYSTADVLAGWLAIGRCCTYCERFLDEHEVTADHFIPLARGGSNWPENIVPACGLCNSDKRDLLFPEWLVDRERRGLDSRVNLMAAA